MAIKDTLIEVLKDLVLPELDALKGEAGLIKVRLTAVEQRLDDFSSRFQAIDQHLIDQSRRIDETRAELTTRIEQQTARIDQQAVRIDQQAAQIDALTTQVTALVQEVAKMRQDSAVMADILRRLALLEEKVAA